MAITGAQLKGMFNGLFPDEVGFSSDLAVKRVHLYTLPTSVNTTNVTYSLGVLPYSCLVTNVTVSVPTTNVAANNTNYTSFNLSYDDGAGGASSAIATANTTSVAGATGAITLRQPAAAVLATTGGVAVASGKQLIFGILQAGNGVTVEAGTLVTVTYKITGS